jgi:hypothetical protein
MLFRLVDNDRVYYWILYANDWILRMSGATSNKSLTFGSCYVVELTLFSIVDYLDTNSEIISIMHYNPFYCESIRIYCEVC